VNKPFDVEKNDHHCFKFGFALPCFLLPWPPGALPVHGVVIVVRLKKKKEKEKKKT